MRGVAIAGHTGKLSTRSKSVSMSVQCLLKTRNLRDCPPGRDASILHAGLAGSTTCWGVMTLRTGTSRTG
jgi:hypothetical protein